MSQYTREQLNQLIQLGTLDEQQNGFQDQLEKAQAFRNEPGQQRRSPWGAALESIGGLVRGVRGKIDEDSARKSIADVLSKKQAGRGVFASILGQDPQGMPPPMPQSQGMPQQPPSGPGMLARNEPQIPAFLRPGYNPFTIG